MQLELNFIIDQPKGIKTSDYVTTDQGVEYHDESDENYLKQVDCYYEDI
jgi:hypothetical protein